VFYRSLLIAALAISSLVACTPTGAPTPEPTPTPEPPCDTSGLSQNALEWSDAVQVASSTGRIALSAPIATLQRIRRETMAREVPECAIVAKDMLVHSMEGTVQGFLRFASFDGTKPKSIAMSANTAPMPYTYNELIRNGYSRDFADEKFALELGTTDFDGAGTYLRSFNAEVARLHPQSQSAQANP
jgi:hypothetical protein